MLFKLRSTEDLTFFYLRDTHAEKVAEHFGTIEIVFFKRDLDPVETCYDVFLHVESLAKLEGKSFEVFVVGHFCHFELGNVLYKIKYFHYSL